jgi:hypothetical protein
MDSGVKNRCSMSLLRGFLPLPKKTFLLPSYWLFFKRRHKEIG